MKRIVFLEKEWMEAEFMCEALERCFPKFKLTTFDGFGDFLTGFDAIAAETSIIISEDRLALCKTTKELPQQLALLKEKFPEAVADWEAPNVPRVLLKHLKGRSLQIPILFYTFSHRDWLDADVLKDPQVTYLEKPESGLAFTSLIQTVQKLLEVPVLKTN